MMGGPPVAGGGAYGLGTHHSPPTPFTTLGSGPDRYTSSRYLIRRSGATRVYGSRAGQVRVLAVSRRRAKAHQADAHGNEPRPQQHPVHPVELRYRKAQCLAEDTEATGDQSEPGNGAWHDPTEHDQGDEEDPHRRQKAGYSGSVVLGNDR